MGQNTGAKLAKFDFKYIRVLAVYPTPTRNKILRRDDGVQLSKYRKPRPTLGRGTLLQIAESEKSIT